ncbi:histidinol-phosphate transaminase [Desulfohalobium retbaense]|uniref:Histidinol-phosphate aminotransferase n=1 Tax=Desulfohalobium retbaense (strain ATCC 49708 / DSM 5692 / JCM 16813 / HR100) TaxID=485915 RepID=C8X4Y4_DESRD|nr:histidinol-phosphate transaminase [Desulfohalobium retbaense]ACV69481.1 histidinol-phosphate aminotransferase [Desulfohalobium retbaense DSM 5692]
MAKFSRVRPEIAGLKPYTPGLSIEEIKDRYALTTVCKMASNENPLGTSPLVQEALCRFAPYAFRYPRGGCPDLSAALAKVLGVPGECVVVGNGSDELIDLLIRTTLRPEKDNMVVFDPSFSIYRMQATLCGVECRQVPLEQDLTFDFDRLLEQVDSRTGLVFVTNPDNPSGHAVPAAQLMELARSLPQQCLLVVDEAYIEFAENGISPLADWDAHGNIVLLRTFSKLYGLAGLRLGYGIMPDWLAEAVLRIKLPFSVNLLAEKAGVAALEDTAFYTRTREVVGEGRRILSAGLRELGCEVSPSQANFLLFRPPMPAREVFERLLAKGIIIRPLTSYGLEDALRVSVGTAHENSRFLEAMQEIVHAR